ncbi:MAG: FISUMP domain-containing protein [Bacteroidales bacterium]|nr:FISUMP domain-containing protein [Bacteroidales bacterium]MDD4500267.1 FISUMP domain-containing protein [Bacteroidales bacterium]
MKKTIISLLALVFIYSCTPQETPNTFTDSRDGKVYKTVTIGEQVWMAENLAYLPEVVGPATGSEDSGNETEAFYYVSGYVGTDVAAAKTTTNYQTYGVLYNWSAALTACPEGWHLPSDEEWTTLTSYMGGADVAGGKMKETGTTHWEDPNTGATNESGFTALPGGYRSNLGTFYFFCYEGFWWSSAQNNKSFAWGRSLSCDDSGVIRGDNYKEGGYSVRCIRD